MESLAYLVLLMALSITGVIFLGLIIGARFLIKRKFPNLKKSWYFLIVPGLLLTSFGLSLVVLNILVLIESVF